MKEKTKKELFSLGKFTLILAGTYLFICCAFAFLPFLNQYQTFKIETASMDPVIKVRDLVIVKETSPGELEVGNIIAFETDIDYDNQDEVVIHYLAEVGEENGKRYFKTNSEYSQDLDRWTLYDEDIVGTYKGKVKVFGNLILFSQSWVGRIILIADIFLVSIVINLLFDDKKEKEVTKEEQEKNDIKPTQ